jgi:molecular chaperone DnaK
MASDNKKLATFRLDGIPPAPRGVPQIEVTFDIDANGILNVAAKDKATNKEQKVTIKVYQGERSIAAHNRLLGVFQLGNIPPAPRGVPQVEVTFDIDANGILNVSAQDKATGKQQNITITSSSGLTKDEIDRMVTEAESNAAEDTKRKEEIEVRNQTDSLVYSTERTLTEHGSKLAEADRKAIYEALGEAKEALKTDDLGRMQRAQETLTRAAHKLAEVMYRETQGQGQAQPGSGGPSAGASGPKEGEVVDAEFEDLGDKK